MMKRICLLSICLITTAAVALAQSTPRWNGKKAAVALTYDDGIDIDLDIVAPALDSFGLKGTFYVIGSAPAVTRRIPEWRKVAANGHELGNHTSFHPCDGRPAGRGFVTPDTDLSRYTLSRMTNETLFTNAFLTAIDGKTERSFAFPCGDKNIGDTPYYPSVEKHFIAARGVTGGMQYAKDVDLTDIRCYFINNHSAEFMIDLVKQAQKNGTLLVFLFHGVGGGHSINVNRGEHTKLLRYLKEQEESIWVAPVVDIARFIKNSTKS